MNIYPTIKITFFIFLFFLFIISIKSWLSNFNTLIDKRELLEIKEQENESFKKNTEKLKEIQNDKSIFHQPGLKEIHLRGVLPAKKFIKEDKIFMEGDEDFIIEDI